MNNDVYIIHASAIVQNGLESIINKEFRCAVLCFPDLIGFTFDNSHQNPIFIIDQKLTKTEEFHNIFNNSKFINSIIIICDESESSKNENFTFISYYDSVWEICRKIKPHFKSKELVEKENDGLSNREIDVLKLVAVGLSNKEIADKLFISIHTVMSHRKNITEKLGIKSISGLTVYALINRYIDTTNTDIKSLI